MRRALEKDAEYFNQVDPANLPADPKGVVAPNARDYNWDLYSGIDYTIDITKPVGERVTQLQRNGADVTPDQTFNIAINNYRASGGGGFAMFREGTIVWQSTSEVRNLMAEYIQAQGTIDPAAINTKNFTLVPDLYANYFGAAQPSASASASPSASVSVSPSASASASASPSASASASVSVAPSASPSASPSAPAQLPDTGGPATPLGWAAAALALAALGGGVAVRRRTS